MISVIIPTMWYSKCIQYQMPILNYHPLVDEIILFNNRPEASVNTVLQFSKVKEQNDGKNNYVGPCWNAGVEMAKNDKIVILNDDVIFNKSLIDFLDSSINEDYGMLCIEPGNVGLVIDNGGVDLDDDRNEPKIRRFLDRISHKPPETHSLVTTDRLRHKAAIIFGIHKNNYVPIPEDLKIYYTDSWVFKMCEKKGKPNFFIKGGEIKSKMSCTVGHFREDTRREGSIYAQIFRNNGLKPTW